jgi:iron complex transport system permease protein
MGYLTRKKFYFTLLSYFVFSLVSFLFSLGVGSENISFFEVIKALFSPVHSINSELIFYQRLPRVLIGFLAGGAFALTGFSYQIVFRNPLATPFTIGVTGGGTLGAVIAISFPSLSFSLYFFNSTQAFSIIGSLIVLIFIFLFTKNKNPDFVNKVLLTGVSIGIVISAFVLLIRYLLTPNILVVVDRWMMGGLSVSGFNEIAGVFPFLIPGIAIMFWLCVRANYLVSGRDAALSKGVNADFTMKLLLIGGTLSTAAVVSVTGPIAFVGLIVPHIIKRISGYDTRVGMPISFLAGGAFLCLCDAISRVIISPSELPVGIITAIIGGIYFIIILNTRVKK